MAKQKYYVVWKGILPGVYDSWEECRKQITNVEGALYKSFPDKTSAWEAYKKGPGHFIGKNKASGTKINPSNSGIIKESIAVDAACSGNPGLMEYRGVYVENGKELFHIGPFPQGTNNVGEFLALVHGLAYLKKHDSALPVYSDSVNAIAWVKNKKCKTKLEPTKQNEIIFELIERAEKWLHENSYSTRILKWETGKWGEIPADFGRK